MSPDLSQLSDQDLAARARARDEGAYRELLSRHKAAVYRLIVKHIGDTDEALHHHDYISVLGRLALLRPQVDAFFDSVMVNVDDAAIRANRLALLKRLADRFRAVAAIEHLSN